MFLYITADRVGTQTGGGSVTAHEASALATFAEQRNDHVLTASIDHAQPFKNPFEQDQEILGWVKDTCRHETPVLAHCYAGCLTETIAYLKSLGCKVVYTAAAHNVGLSMQEHQKLGVPFEYPHLTEPKLWRQYLKGYQEADVLVCPSIHSADIMRVYDCKQRIEVIPHGCHLPETTKPLPVTFTVGYLGSFGCDKGVRYLLKAWRKLAYKDAILMLGGRDSTSSWVQHLIATYGGGNVWCRGWIENVSDFYDDCSLYVQPSVTEGFGMEVLEAMAHGRAVVCSVGVGASDLLELDSCYPPMDVDVLCERIDRWHRRHKVGLEGGLMHNRSQASSFTWDKIHARYQNLWKEVLS